MLDIFHYKDWVLKKLLKNPISLSHFGHLFTNLKCLEKRNALSMVELSKRPERDQMILLHYSVLGFF